MTTGPAEAGAPAKVSRLANAKAALSKGVSRLYPAAGFACGVSLAAGILFLISEGIFQSVGTATVITVVKDALQALQAAVTIGAIIVGGYWFVRHRRGYPRLDVTHIISHERLTDEVLWLRVIVKLENKGEVLIKPGTAVTRVSQVLPIPPGFAKISADERPHLLPGRTDIFWKKVRECSDDAGPIEVEPGETATLEYDFLLSSDTAVLVIYTFVPNQEKQASSHGWPVESIYRIAPATTFNTPGTNGESATAHPEARTDLHTQTEPRRDPSESDQAGAESAGTATVAAGEMTMIPSDTRPVSLPQPEPQNTIKPEPVASPK